MTKYYTFKISLEIKGIIINFKELITTIPNKKASVFYINIFLMIFPSKTLKQDKNTTIKMGTLCAVVLLWLSLTSLKKASFGSEITLLLGMSFSILVKIWFSSNKRSISFFTSFVCLITSSGYL